MTAAEIVTRARELDDDQPDNVCPGCGQDITGWEHHWAHYPPGSDLSDTNVNRRARRGSAPMPWLPHSGGRPDGGAERCPWDRDFLTARAFRRQLIATERSAA